ncbi:MAG: ABC transporter ATP-binding protein [Asticcacaulis sp.]
MTLSIHHLKVARAGKPTLNLEGVTLEAGQVLGLIGPSGSGKSTAARALINLPEVGEIIDARVTTEVGGLQRGTDIGLIFQDPLKSFNPLISVGDHALEALRHHTKLPKREAWAKVKAAFRRVGLPDEDAFLKRYPHQLSGGQRQRAAIAGVIVLKPQWLIADEATSALDTLAQAHVADVLKSLVEDDGIGLIFISHDLGLVARLADQLVVLSGGEVIERGPTSALITDPQHEVTRQLLRASQAPDFAPTTSADGAVVLEGKAITRRYVASGHAAVSDISLSLKRGQCLGIVGESGSGKSTLLRTLLALDAPQAGAVYLGGQVFSGTRNQRRKIQAVFQDPAASFNPRWDVKRIITEPLRLSPEPLSATEITRRAEQAVQVVGLEAEVLTRLPHQFSGGQKQKIAIARALILEPEIIVLDEAVSALDALSKSEILDLLQSLKQSRALSLVFVSHDLMAVKALADHILILKEGSVLEQADTRTLFRAPSHAYTQALLAATPVI